MFKVHVPTLARVSELNPAAYNPRKITPEKYEALKESIKSDGFLEPLVVQKQGLRIIGGHQRLRAIKEICVEEGERCPDIPCIVLDLDDRSAKRLNIKLNNIQGEFEVRMLGELLVDIYEDEGFKADDAAMLGFLQNEAEKVIRLIEPTMVPPLPPMGDEPSSFGKSITLSLEFDSVAMRDKVKKLLVENAKTAKRKSGDLVAAALGLVKKKAPKTKRAA
jgi:ParB-like chromosome segregation protein Spo0J